MIYNHGFQSDIQREEKNVQKAIREAAKRNDMGSAKVLISSLIDSLSPQLIYYYLCQSETYAKACKHLTQFEA